MSAEVKKEIQLEIAHVLFIDIVGYSKLSINEQRGAVDELTRIVRATDQFQKAEAADRLTKIATGDGMALVFYSSPEAPVRCAMELSRALKDHPRLDLRMGIHSGPVSGVVDVTGRTNLAGAGINMAQRVMDCGDAGHILLSKHVAEDLAEYDDWRPLLHDLGTCEVKHGIKLQMVNLNGAEVGRRELPKKLQMQRRRSARMRGLIGAAVLVAIAALLTGIIILWRNQSALTQAAPDKSIAVLPFGNLSEEKQNAYFTDGVQDEILMNLAKIADLKVISRTSVMQYKSDIAHNLRKIGQQLGVTHVLEGSVQRAGNRVRVNVQLIDARTDRHLWAEHYDRPLDDVFAIQTQIAQAIVDNLRVALSSREASAIGEKPTSDLAAYDLYLRAKELIASSFFSARFGDDLSQAARFLDQAVARDSHFLLAYCSLAEVHNYLYFYGIDHSPKRLALAAAAVENALRLGPDRGEAHLAKAQHLYQGYLDYDGARAELAIAGKTLPNDSRVFELAGYVERRQGRQEEGLKNLQRALELDPRNIGLLQQISGSYQNLRRYSETAAVLDQALAIAPNDVETRVSRAGVNFHQQADTRPLHATIEAILTENPTASESIADEWFNLALCERDLDSAERALSALGEHTFGKDAVIFSRKFGEGLVARMRGDAAAAQTAFLAAHAQQQELLRAQSDYAPALCALGVIDAALERKEEALRQGLRAAELLPVEKDAYNGVHVLEFLAVIYAWTGERDLACQQLAFVSRLPTSPSYGELKLHPFWDPLRGDPRFEKIVASLAPKEK
jgi:TolB-like protein/class 3 adenylate cyclase